MFEREGEKLKKFQELINYNFNNEDLLRQALTTPLLGNETNRSHYDQILETLGDSVIKTIFILKKFKEKIGDPEIITKTKQAIENDVTLTLIAENYFNLEKYVFKTISQNVKGTRILADVFEAICGAVFLDSDLNVTVVENSIIDVFYEDWELIIMNTSIFNKNILLEYLQQKFRITPSVRSQFEKYGPDHDLKWIAKNPKIFDQNDQLLPIKLPLDLKSEAFKSKKDAEQDLFIKIYKYFYT